MFGYWKKYAEFEDSLSRTEEAKQIFERGVNAVSTAVDLWAQYCAYVMSKSSDLDEIREYVAFYSCSSKYLVSDHTRTLFNSHSTFMLVQLSLSDSLRKLFALPEGITCPTSFGTSISNSKFRKRSMALFQCSTGVFCLFR